MDITLAQEYINTIKNNPELLDSTIRDYFLLNFSKITRRHYQGSALVARPVNAKVFRYIVKKFKLWDRDEASEENVYEHLYGKPSPCKYNNIPNFRTTDIGFDVCGDLTKCPCAKDRHNAASFRSEEEVKRSSDKRRETFLKKYGVDNIAKRPETWDKIKKTNLERYGAEHPTNDPEVIKKRKRTNLERYGTENPMESSVVKEKVIKTNIERYGVANPMHVESIKNKVKETSEARYGDVWKPARDAYAARTGYTNPFQNPEIKQKSKETNLEKRGVEYAARCPITKEKKKTTNIERYGVDNPMKVKEIRERLASNNIEKYGIANPQKLDEVKERTKQSNLTNYGVEYPQKLEGFKEKVRKTTMERFGVDYHAKLHYSDETILILEDKDLFSKEFTELGAGALANKLGVTNSTIYKYTSKYGIETAKGSSGERALADWVSTLEIPMVTNVRKIIPRYELDIYIPSHKLGIEFNGIYWHSSLHKANDYHQKKYLLCREAGIRLIMINEDEWNHNPEIIKSKILNILGMSERGVGARKLSIRSVGSSQANDFFDRHHIQGRTGSILSSTGAFLDDQLVSCMSFNKQRGTDMIELIRYATDGRTYAGAFSRLFRHAVEQNGYDEVISFADLRYSDGAVYRSNGFELVRTIAPDYRYVFGESTYHKSSFTKKNIEKKFGIDMTGLTERVVMEMLEIPRLYDCGKLKYRWVRQ